MTSHNQPKAALVTGAAQRIGRKIALKLASLGYDIALHYNHSDKEARDLSRLIKSKKRRCELFSCDFTDADQTQNLLPAVYKKYPYLNLLINGASIFQELTFQNSHWQNLENNFCVHVRAPYILTAEFAKRCKNGQIINLLDTHINDNRLSHFDYLLTKKTLAEFTKLSAVALAPYVRVNGIAPGIILAPVGKPKGHLNRLAKDIPLKRKGSPEKIIETIEFLLINDFITGQIIFVDGGEHLI